jgi:hypothetical protein
MNGQIKTYKEFDSANGILTPDVFREYLNGENVPLDKYNENFIRFYSWSNILSVDESLGDQKGLPDCTNIINTMSIRGNCYVFADYMFSMFFYAIFLKEGDEKDGQIYIISGDKFKLISKSFEGFIELCSQNSLKLQW